jgi:hypothetical protein
MWHENLVSTETIARAILPVRMPTVAHTIAICLAQIMLAAREVLTVRTQPPGTMC